MPAATRTEGFVDVGPGRVWYERAGEGPRTVLVLHGGPGGNCEDLLPLMDLAGDGFTVVRFDQLGSWRSDQPDDPSLWNVARFVEEVERVRTTLGLGKVHLLGQSWGAMLALEYALHHQGNLESLTLASGAASVRECVDGMDAWRRELPEATQATLARHEATADYGHPDYVAAIDVLYRKHLCRVWPYPEPFAEAGRHMAAPVYTSMWGPNEFTCTGSLLSWDRTDRLGEIRVPTLITVGEFDEVRPSCSETMHRGIPGSKLVVFPDGGHAIHCERPDEYRAVVREFLDAVDAAPAA